MAALDLLLTGDLILDVPDPDHWLSGLQAVTSTADLTIGHLEVPHTLRGEENPHDVPAPAADPAHLAALQRSRFGALTLAGNHIADCGAAGIADTIAELEQLGIAHCGAGLSLAAARSPALLQRSGVRLALLSYNCVGPESSWAGPDRAGCAFLRIEPEDGGAITPQAALTRIDPASLDSVRSDIAQVRAHSDLLVVAFHKGIVHRPAALAPYERPISYAAIDAGADVVIGHHAHIVRGIELYRGRPIFHGLGNGCVVTRALSPDETHPKRAAWVRRRRELFGFEPDPAYTLAPFHPEAVHAMVARIHYRSGVLEAGFVPLYVEPPGRPRLPTGEQALQVTRYIADITVRAGLPALSLDMTPDMVRIRN
jgi:poly-gamma-glutamate capsule biosynthesis protein CapA/YwtB (metallophosphatase superfamily)